MTAILGMAFWIVAARLYPSDAVGRDSALIAAMIQLSVLAQLNLANTLIRFMPGSPAAGRMLTGAYAVTALAGVVLASGFVLLAPHVSEDLRFLTSEPLTGAGYVVAVVLWGMFALQDAALTAIRRASWVLAKNGLFGALKIVRPAADARARNVAWDVPQLGDPDVHPAAAGQPAAAPAHRARRAGGGRRR